MNTAEATQSLKGTSAVIVDIETRGNSNMPSSLATSLMSGVKADGRLKDQSKIDEDIAKKRAEIVDGFALNPLTNQVVVAVVIDVDTGKEYRFTHETNELSVLKGLNLTLKDLNPAMLVTFNGTVFDIPIIATRSIVNGIASAPILQRISSYKYSAESYDIRNALTGGNRMGLGTLEQWYMLFNPSYVPSDDKTHVLDLSIPDLEAKCVEDCRKTLFIFNAIKSSLIGG